MMWHFTQKRIVLRDIIDVIVCDNQDTLFPGSVTNE